MARGPYSLTAFVFVFLLLLIPSYELQSSQMRVLLRIKRLLGYPAVLSSWRHTTDFCNGDPLPVLSVVCYEESITQIHIIGKEQVLLPKNFSIDSFFTTLSKLPTLKVLSLVSLGLWGPLPAKIVGLTSLEILNITSNFLYGVIPPELWSLSSLQAIILDNNLLSGQIPPWLAGLPFLTVMSLKNNSFNGSLPSSIGALDNLRVILLANNQFSGEVPDISSLTNLQVLDLENNHFGPLFPALGSKVETLVLKNNRFSSAIPSHMNSSFHLQRFDISANRFIGPFPSWLLSLPSLHYLDIAGNRLTGMLFENMTCNSQLDVVDLSGNLLSGSLPSCLESNAHSRVVKYSENCFTNDDQDQHPPWFCKNQALAVGLVHHKQKRVSSKKAAVSSIVSGVIGGTALMACLLFLVKRRMSKKSMTKSKPEKLTKENPLNGIPTKLLSDARYISQTMKSGALDLPSYRSFSLEELEEATNKFDTPTFMGEGSLGQIYRGTLSNGSCISISCLKLKRKHVSQDFNVELISKFRHAHLVSALGHFLEFYTEDCFVSRMFVVFEHVPNVTLKSKISGPANQRLSWNERVSAAIGIAKGIQYLHSGIVPGVYGLNLTSSIVLVDQNCVAKIMGYNLPVLAKIMSTKEGMASANASSKEISCISQRILQDAMTDMYDFGIILLEIITGCLINSRNVTAIKHQLQSSASADEISRKSLVDPAIANTCLDQSLRTVMDICFKCLSMDPKEQPSVEDVLWNLQFAAQVQEYWKGEFHSSEESPVSPFQPPHLKIDSVTDEVSRPASG